MSEGWALGGYTFSEYKCTMHIFGPGESLREVLSLKQGLDLHAFEVLAILPGPTFSRTIT